MQLLYDSMTGNVQRFARAVQADLLTQHGLDVPLYNLRQAAPSGEAGGHYLLLTYTFGQGEIAPFTAAFLAQHSAGLRGVVASGSFHWGEHFGRAGDLIAQQYGVPLVARLNKGGTQQDRAKVVAWVRQMITDAPKSMSSAYQQDNQEVA